MKYTDMKKGMVVPREIGQASVIQQLGLNTPEGVQRLLMILLHYADPKNEGITLDLPVLNSIVNKMANQHKVNLLVKGEDDKLFVKAVDSVELYFYHKQQKTGKK